MVLNGVVGVIYFFGRIYPMCGMIFGRINYPLCVYNCKKWLI
ncbi:hypothetical protein [Moraxella lacunata]